MKKYLLVVASIILLLLGVYYLYYYEGVYIPVLSSKEVYTDFTVNGRQIFVNQNNQSYDFEIRGVDMGSGIPGKWSTDFDGTKDMYLRWFKQIKEMGANTVRIYTVNSVDFYDAFYEFNVDNDDPLYLLQGVWIDEYAQNSHIDGYDDEFIGAFTNDCKRAVDVIHGRRNVSNGESSNVAKGNFRKDISKWVLGYIIGVEWEPVVVTYTDDNHKDDLSITQYAGNYLQTTDDASPFEALLCRVGDSMIDYESSKYGCQRLLAFSNWPTTDPFSYPEDIKLYLRKYCSIDVEHIKSTDQFISGQFASYHIYPYYPNYINYMDDWSIYGIDNPKDYLVNGEIKSYSAYLYGIAEHHSIPVIISEFGVPSSRGMASRDVRQGYNQGFLTESEQAEILVSCYKDIMNSGCAGCCIFSWQDEWFKHAWNTLYASDTKRTAYWSDYQTVEQAFGLLGFDTGADENLYNDGIVTEWSDNDIISTQNGITLMMRNDEKYLYFRIHDINMDFENSKYYIPIDVTPKSGSVKCDDNSLNFNREADFLISINGKDDSKVTVQERYDSIRSTLSNQIYGFDTYLKDNIPSKNSSKFVDIRLGLQEPTSLIYGEERQTTNSSYVTGKLTYGNGNPNSEQYCSYSDFYYSDNNIEIRIPWALLNFSDPSNGEIHDDYYENYGICYLNINSIYAGISSDKYENECINLCEYKLNTWNESVTASEYLKESYYAMQEIWTSNYDYSSEEDLHVERTVEVFADYSIPALMYHDFKIEGIISEEDLGEYAITSSEFEDDLKYLKENGYTTLTSTDVLDIKSGNMEMPSKPIILTIDDGRYGVYEVAYPLLKKYDMNAVLAVIGTYIDDETIAADKTEESSRRFNFCTWQEIKEMQDSGFIEIINHSYGLHDYDEQEERLQSGEWEKPITNDTFKVFDTLNRNNIDIINAMAYPFSLRNRESDKAIFDMGYQLIYTGDIYTIENDLQYTYTSKYGLSNQVYLVPRTARYHGNNIEYWLNLHQHSINNVLNIPEG